MKRLEFKKLPSRRLSRLLAALCSAFYAGGYLTRVNFAAVTVGIIEETGWEKTEISSVTTALFIAYGIGQIISGLLGDRLRPDLIMIGGLGVSVLLNFSIVFCRTIPAMTAIWAVNGLAQAMLWPPIVRITAGYCTAKDYEEATVITSWGSAVGTVLVYLISSLCIKFAGWRTVFFICSGIAFLILVCFAVVFPMFVRYAEANGISEEDLPEAGAKATRPGHNTKNPVPTTLAIISAVICGSTFLMGVLRDSISTWLPNYVTEVFSIDESAAVLSGVLIPIMTAISYPVTLAFYRKFFSDEITCAATVYSFSALASVILYFVYGSIPALSVFLLAFTCTCMHAANYLIIGLVPKRFEKYGRVATASGLFNAFVYAGSAVSIWGIAAIAENAGWHTTTLVWFAVALADTILCFSLVKPWRRFFKEK